MKKDKMRITLLLACLAILLVQCRKNTVDNIDDMPSGETIEVNLTVDNSDDSKTEITPGGIVVWKQHDRIYVVGSDASDGGYLGYLEAQNEGSSAYFTGTIRKTVLQQDFHFYYVGDNTFPTTGDSYTYDISLQNGKLGYEDNGIAKNLHLMHFCSASVVPGTTNLGVIRMESLMSIANMMFKRRDNAALGTVVCKNGYSSATLNTKTGELSSKTVGDITLNNVVKEERYYIALIPGTQTLTFQCNGLYERTMPSKNVVENMMYTNDIVINMDFVIGALKGKFSIGNNKQVYFSKGNLWYSPAGSGTFQLEENQWDKQAGSSWNPNHVCHFFWSKSPWVTYVEAYFEGEGTSADDVYFTNNTINTPNENLYVNGQRGIWRCLSHEEFQCILDRDLWNDGTKSYAAGAYSGVKGYVFFPDDWDKEASYANGITYGVTDFAANTITDDMFAHGAVFLPYAGSRDQYGNINNNDDSDISANYHFSDSYGKDLAYYLTFNGASIAIYASVRSGGYTVRMVTDVLPD